VQNTPEVKKRFPAALDDLVQSLVDRGAFYDRGSVADFLGIKHPRLKRLLNGKNVAGARTVAKICSHLERRDASRLLEAYLRDEIELVTKLAKEQGADEWGSDKLVLVEMA
jgi:hypothetical protein